MIGQLRGKIIEKHPPFLMIEVGGVGYYLQAPLSTFFVLPNEGEVILRTHLVVREDAQLLFGFASSDECRLFQELIKLNGVGPKVALAILSGLTPQEFINVVMMLDVKHLQRLPGIGAKMAQRIVVEMQDRLPKLNLSLSKTSLTDLKPRTADKDESIEEAVAALMSLGYKPQEALKAVNKVQDTTLGCEHIIKEALQGLAKV